jgi:alpha-beta hydrolase superfamily lysophospholipase
MNLFTSDGVELAAQWWPCVDTARATLVLVHGLAATKDHPQVRSLALRFRSGGFDVLSYDARGHGESGGMSTLGDLERLDVAAAVQWAGRHGAPIVLVGASMGAVAVLRYAATDPALAGVVVVSSPAEWRIPLSTRALLTAALARTKLGRRVADRRMGVRIAPVWTAPEPPRSLVDRVACPLGVVHGRRDALIPARSGLARYATEGAKRRVIIAPDMGHAFDPAGHDAICEAVEWVLQQAEEPDPVGGPPGR